MGWGVLGQSTYLIAQLLTLVALTRLAEVDEVGTVALATSVVVPIFFFFNLSMQVNFASGANAGFVYRDYRKLLIVSVGVGYLLAVTIALTAFDSGLMQTLVIILGLAKAVESLSELSYGVFQRYQRMNYVAISLMARGVISTATIWLLLWWEFSLQLAFLCQLIIWSLMAWLFDMRLARQMADQAGDDAPASFRRMKDLVRSSLMLGFTNLVSALHGNMPRYVIAGAMSVVTLGYFTVVGYAMQATVTLFWVIMHSLVSRLALFIAGKDAQALRSVMTNLLLGVLAFAVFSIGTSLLIGDWVIETMFGANYAGLGPLLALCMLAASIQGVEVAMEALLVAARRFGPLLWLRSAATVLLLVTCTLGMIWGGLIGLALGISVAYALHVTALVFAALPLLRPART